MPTNSESLNNDLYRLLSKYKPKPLDAEGKITPVPDEADVIKFEFTKDGEEYGTVYASIDEDRVLNVYFGDDVANSPDEKTPGVDYDDSWWGLYQQLSAWRMTKGLRGFKTHNKDRINDDMARRKHMRNKDKIAEGYYPMGKSRSYSDAVPSVKIVIEHSRVIEEGEQRYRNINRIFLENQDGERYLLDTKKPGIARVYARHIAEGGKVNDDRWNHVHSLCEEYSKMAGFVRATRNGQFNESAQSLVNEGIAHYQSLRESLSRMTGKRGYNAYFESWTPALMETEGDETNLNELFVQETLDPRIESVMPILSRIHKKVSESAVDKEVNKLAEWADSLTEEESIKSNNPVGIPESLDQHSPVTQAITRRILSQHPDLLKKFGPEKVGDAIDDVAEFVGDVEEIGSSDVSGWVKQVAQSLGGHEGQLDEFDIDTLNQLASHPMAGTLAAAGGAAIGATIGKGITKAADWYKNRQEKKAQDHDMRGNKVAEEVDTGQYDAVKPISNSGTTPEQEKEFRKKVQAYGKELEKRQKEKEGVTEDSHEEQVARLAAYNERMAGENPPIDLGLREVGNWAKVGHYGNPIKTAWYNIAKYGVRQNRFNNSVEEVMSAIGEFPDLEDEVYDMYDINQDEVDALYHAYETVYDQYDQLQGQQGVAEDLDANQKRVGQLGPTEKVGPKGAVGKLVGANENFINTVDQAVVSEEDEMAESILSAIKKVGKKVLDKVAPDDDELLNQLDKDVHGGKAQNRYNSDAESAKKYPANSWKAKVDEAALPWEDDDEAEKREKEDKENKDTKGKDGAEHGGHSRAKHLAKQAIPKDDKEEVNESEERPYVCVHAKKGKCEVKASSSYQAAQKAAQKWGLKGTAGIDAHLADVEKDTSSLEESTDELARILQIMNHRR